MRGCYFCGAELAAQSCLVELMPSGQHDLGGAFDVLMKSIGPELIFPLLHRHNNLDIGHLLDHSNAGIGKRRMRYPKFHLRLISF